MLNRSGWHVTGLESDRPNPKLGWTAPDWLVTVLIGLGTIMGRFRNMDLLNCNPTEPAQTAKNHANQQFDFVMLI